MEEPDQEPGAAWQSAYPLSLTLNGDRRDAEVDSRVTLLDLLREVFGATGTKKGCDHGQCGACTVLVNGIRINACLSLALMHEGDEVVTVEGMASGDSLHPLQSLFIQHDGFQCGYCTPGQICSVIGALDEIRRRVPSHVSTDLTADPVPSLDEMRERMSGNICRCGAYANIQTAIAEYAGARS